MFTLDNSLKIWDYIKYQHFFKILIFCNICKGFNNLCVSTELSQYRGHILVQAITNYTVCRFMHLKQNQFHKSRSHLTTFCHTRLVKCADLCASQSYYGKWEMKHKLNDQPTSFQNKLFRMNCVHFQLQNLWREL